MTLNSLGGSTLQCNTWFWDDMTPNSPGDSTRGEVCGACGAQGELVLTVLDSGE